MASGRRELRGRGRVRLALGLVLLALVVRMVGAVASFGEPLVFDAKDFDRHARSIAAGVGYPEAVHPRGGPSALRPPGFAFVLGATYAVVGETDARPGWDAFFAPGYVPDATGPDAGRVVQALIGTILAALVGLVAFQLWGSRVGLVALAIAALYPPLIILGFTLLSDPLFVVFVLAAVAAALRARAVPAHRLRWAAAAGALTGLAWLTRSNGALVLVPLAALVWTVRPRLRPRSLAAPAALVAAALLVVLPWTLRNAVEMDSFVVVSDNGGYTLAGTYNDSAREDKDFRGGWRPAQDDPAMRRLMAGTGGELEQSRALGRAARRYMADRPLYVAQVGWCNTLRLVYLAWLSCGDEAAITAGYEGEQMVGEPVAYAAIVAFAVVLLLAVAGAFTRGSRAAPKAFWLVPILLWTVVFVLAANRFRAPIEPFLIMLAALALVAGFDRIRARRT